MFDLYEREDFDFDHASLFAESSCKECYGKGFKIVQLGTGAKSATIRKDRFVHTLYRPCSCTKNMQRKVRNG